MKLNYIFFLILYSLLFISPSYAHTQSTSYITLMRSAKCEAQRQCIIGEWHIALRDLDYAVGLDDNADGSITWGELKKHHKDIEEYSLPKFKMQIGDYSCKNKIIKHLVENHSDGAYAVLRFKIETPKENLIPKKFNLEYDFLFDLDEQHRSLLNIKHKGKAITAIFSSEKKNQHFNLDSQDPLNQFLEFTKGGVWHIWIGFDHILFLLALLLPAVLRKSPFWDTFKIVTAFTIAHSITLSAAALGVIELPSRLVESLIAASVVLAALNNIFPIFKENRWLIAFLFGLIHGFGFASVLMDLGLPKETLLIALVSFNIGVEIGQLAIVCLFLPIAYKLREHWIYKKLILIGGSVLIVLTALIWFIERAFNLSLLQI